MTGMPITEYSYKTATSKTKAGSPSEEICYPEFNFIDKTGRIRDGFMAYIPNQDKQASAIPRGKDPRDPVYFSIDPKKPVEESKLEQNVGIFLRATQQPVLWADIRAKTTDDRYITGVAFYLADTIYSSPTYDPDQIFLSCRVLEDFMETLFGQR